MSDESTATFQTRVRHGADAVVIEAEGELDIVGAPRLMESIPDDGGAKVFVDLSSVRFMDSSGLRALLDARRTCLETGRGFALARPSEAVRRVLNLVDVGGELEVVEGPPA